MEPQVKATVLVLAFVGCFFSLSCHRERPEKTPEGTLRSGSISKTYRLSATELKDTRKRAEAGDAEAAYWLSMHYLMADRNAAEHKRWLEYSARAGYGRAQYGMGYFCFSYHRYDDADHWLRLAVETTRKNGDKETEQLAVEVLEELKSRQNIEGRER